jgi:polyhydroxybutyrate depolymerase
MRRHRLARNLAALTAAALALTVGAGCTSTKSSAGRAPATNQAPVTAQPASTHATGPSAGCRVPPVKPGITDDTISSGGKKRAYQLDVPAGYDGTKPYALVFGLHSLTVDYRIVLGMAGFADMHKKYEYIGVSPSGLVSTVPYWNAAPVADNDDVAFIAHLLDHLEDTLCLDTGKVFSVGMSNGAQMSSLLACRLADRITAIAPIAGVEYNQPCTGGPVPIVAFHGIKDPFVPYKGGGLNSVTIADQNLYHGKVPPETAAPTGVDESMRNWARHNGCGPDYVETRVSHEVRKRVWQHCRAATEIYIVDNGGHAWPGKPQPAFEQTFGHGTTDIDATNLMFSFFFDHKT